MALPANPKDRRIKTNNPFEMGKLLKTWATGRNYVDNPQFPIPGADNGKHPRPTSFKEFVDQCVAGKVTLTYDDGDMTAGIPDTPVDAADEMGFVMLQGDTSTLVIRLSPKGFIDKSEVVLINSPPGTYNLTEFYKNVLVNPAIKPAKTDTELHRLETHAASIGDYTIRTCA
jgi:hypothetical protein